MYYEVEGRQLIPTMDFLPNFVLSERCPECGRLPCAAISERVECFPRIWAMQCAGEHEWIGIQEWPDEEA